MTVTKILNTYKFNKIDTGSIQKRRTLGRKKLLRHQTRFEYIEIHVVFPERQYKNVNSKNFNIQI